VTDMEWQQIWHRPGHWGCSRAHRGLSARHGEMPLGGLVGDEHHRPACRSSLTRPLKLFAATSGRYFALTACAPRATISYGPAGPGIFLRYGDDHPQIRRRRWRRPNAPPTKGPDGSTTLAGFHAGLIGGDPEGLLSNAAAGCQTSDPVGRHPGRLPFNGSIGAWSENGVNIGRLDDLVLFCRSARHRQSAFSTLSAGRSSGGQGTRRPFAPSFFPLRRRPPSSHSIWITSSAALRACQ